MTLNQGETARTPQTFEDWCCAWWKANGWTSGPPQGLYSGDSLRACWDAALASQRAIITDAANQIDDMQAQLADVKAEIDRLNNALRVAEYDRDVIAPSNAADVDAILKANNRLQAELRTAREALRQIAQIGSWSAGTMNPIPQFAPSNAAAIALTALDRLNKPLIQSTMPMSPRGRTHALDDDRLTTSEDK